MIIGIDASRALKKQRTGTEVHNAEIIKNLVAIDRENTYRLYASIPPYGDLLNLGPHVEWRVMPFGRGWTLIRLSAEMVKNPPDVLFVPAHALPWLRPKKSIVMIHDLGFDHYPHLYKWTDKLYHRYAVRFAKLFASHILTPSDFTRHDLHEKYGVPLKKITTVYHGFEPKEFRPKQPNEAPPITEPYFYFVGRLEYKKNVKRMLEAFAAFKQQTGLPHKFILAGRPAYGYEAIQHAHESMGEYKDDVSFLGHTSQEVATHYLRHAEALVFCTLFEGFGMPVLEAYASGTPVITSNTTCLPEVAGDAALLVDPTNTEEITQAMSQLAQDKELRSSLKEKGSKRYKEFSWERSAYETLAVIKKVVDA